MSAGFWYRAALNDDGIDRQVSTIREQFADALEAAGWPDGACLFVTDEGARRRRIHAIFFSPAAVSAVPHLIAVCGAAPSPPPDRVSATLLVGKPTDWDLLPRLTH